MTSEELRATLRLAYRLGQNYWAKANSEETSYWKKADVTQAAFVQLVEDTVLAFEAAKPCPYIRSTAEGTHHCALANQTKEQA